MADNEHTRKRELTTREWKSAKSREKKTGKAGNGKLEISLLQIFYSLHHTDLEHFQDKYAQTPAPQSTSLNKYLKELTTPPSPLLYFCLGSQTGNILHTKLRLDISKLNAHLFFLQKNRYPILLWRTLIRRRKTFLAYLLTVLCSTSKPFPILIQSSQHRLH